MFESCGTIVNFRFLTSERPDKQMALLEFTNTSSAICGLVQFHNKEVREVGIEWAIAQSRELKAAGVPVLHYYSMGKSSNIQKIAEAVF